MMQRLMPIRFFDLAVVKGGHLKQWIELAVADTDPIAAERAMFLALGPTAQQT